MSVQVEVPEMAESVSDITLLEWLKHDGEYVERDEPICILATDQADVQIPAPAAGILHPLAEAAQALAVGIAIARIDDEADAIPPAGAPATEEESATAPTDPPDTADLEGLSPAVRSLVEDHHLDPDQIRGTGRGGRLIKQDVTAYIKEQERDARDSQAVAPGTVRDQGMVAPQRITGTSTAFNEIDLSQVMALRHRHQERFREKHGVSLGLTSFFARACAVALQEFPQVNACLKGDDIAYHDLVNLGIAVSTERGLLFPVLRGVENMTMASIEGEIKRLASGAGDGSLGHDELSGDALAITDRGNLGSFLSTPILTPPRSAILGMHTIEDRPVAIDGQVLIRPMMYVALTCDLRLIDEPTSFSFLVRLKELLEDPTRLMLEI